MHRFGSFSQGMKILQYYVCMPNFMIRTFLVLEIWGQKGSKMGVFGLFSKSNAQIWFVLLGNEDIMVLRVHAKFHDQNFSGSRDIGVKRVKNGVFWTFLKNLWMNLVHSPREQRYYSITCPCQISRSEHFWFSRQGAKRGQKWGCRTFLKK